MHRGFSGMTAHHIQQTATHSRLFIYVTSPRPLEGSSLPEEVRCCGGTEESKRCRKRFQSGARQAPVCPRERSWRRFIFLA